MVKSNGPIQFHASKKDYLLNTAEMFRLAGVPLPLDLAAKMMNEGIDVESWENGRDYEDECDCDDCRKL